ncbi:Crp/Fnr family transcriptional regulator [Pedobacter gandavensis]|uniref:Crp/Fnr family transcriptional regulator n=1 Tax=Pedobacter gandavensis TaxID=2679963 RepID=UPI00247ACE38|nr:Crp/Fnr family transcriptional regulator [Pedobacter gandavensis]WGQ11570.1 Crp/Fnr family transcriptional regulator [Pedobacter gandavensis]
MFKLLENYLRQNAEFDDESLSLIFGKFKLIKTKRNEILLDYNEVCKHHYFVNKGCIRLYTVNSAGLESTRFFALEGGFGTALPSLIDQQPAHEYLQTIEKSELLTITRADFYNLVDHLPQFAKIYRNILELGFITAQKRIYGFQGLNAMEKVKWINTYYPGILLRISNKMTASYLGISPSTLSRTKTKL